MGKLEEIEAYCRRYSKATHPKEILRRWFPSPHPSSMTVRDGANLVPYGIYWGAWEMENGQVRVFRNIHAKNHTECNGLVMAWSDGEALPVDPPAVIEDCIFENAAARPPKSKNGTSEANLWVGCTAQSRRVKLSRGAWMGLWTGGDSQKADGGCFGSVFEDFTIFDQRIGVYVEHVTRNTTFRRFNVTATEAGFNVEWWYDGRGSHSCVIEDFDITCPGWSISLDAGTYNFKIRNGVIRGGKGIELPKRLVDPSKPNLVENVRWADGKPVVPVYHDRAIG